MLASTRLLGGGCWSPAQCSLLLASMRLAPLVRPALLVPPRTHASTARATSLRKSATRAAGRLAETKDDDDAFAASVLFEDNHCLAINKPPGLLCQVQFSNS